MDLVEGFIQTTRDLRTMGSSFAIAGVRRRVSRKLVPMQLGRHRVWVRGGNSDFTAFRQVLRDRSYALGITAYEEQVQRRYHAMLASGRVPVIIDAGANVGAAALWFHQQFPRAVVLAVEPDPGNIAILRRNVEEIAAIRVVPAAIGAEPGFVSLEAEECGWSTQTTRAESGIAIVTVDELVGTVEQGELFQVKVDIEGFERDLFASNLGWLDEAEVVYVEPHDWKMPGEQTSASFQKALAERDFGVLIVGENLIYVRHRPG